MAVGSIDPSQYEQQLAEKKAGIKAQFSLFNVPEIEVFTSAEKHYRLRAEFRVWHDGDDLYHIMFNPEDKSKFRVDSFLPAHETVYQLMPVLIDALKPNDILRRKLYQIDYLSTLSGEILVSLIYHRPLDEHWETEIKQLKETLSSQFNIQFIGRSRKQKLLVERDFVLEKLNVDGKELVYKQVENSFTQPNGIVNQKMLSWARSVSEGLSGDLLELYCGNGNFSLALADRFERVLGTEISKPSVQSAQFNIAANQIENVEIIRISSEEFSDARLHGKPHKSLKNIDFSSYNCNTVLVDPPRAGLDEETVKLVQSFDHIIYISCNPDTLVDNLKTLTETHTVERFAIFDQFPYTHHIESGVMLTKK
ncbi:tRNA (uridine(54)-C5)-methyltransferase TrmA [Algicola sagamiensis]|uniref:tRNA (uridine(54)-C5)-methyltransferase TrmA n=1 Tax=Algicola sagamiensis TaxID=163869 RepID=UPI00036B0D22|nr:tRNA (uridine(54)-C5)-methyltransferase TrmA [Algicola sagamiensis]